MIDISKGRYWDEGITLVSSCTRVSVGCENCWALAMDHRFMRSGSVEPHGERLCRFSKKKPTVFSIWNDLFHPVISDSFQYEVYKAMILNKQHKYLILTKRPERMADFFSPKNCFTVPDMPHIWHGLTICNQQEADWKIPIFLQVPGKKFLSIEPMLGAIDLSHYLWFDGANGQWFDEYSGGFKDKQESCYDPQAPFDAILLGAETGGKARQMDIEWVRSIRNQCSEAGVSFFLKQIDKSHKRELDGRTHDDLPWVKS